MKKILMTFAAVLCCAMAASMFTACDVEVTGDFVYSIGVSDDTSSAAYGSYWASGAETTILAEVAKVATKLDVGSDVYMINGRESDCNNKIKAAVDAGMNKVEAQSDYNSFFDISGATVVVKSVNNSNEVIYSRTFKK